MVPARVTWPFDNDKQGWEILHRERQALAITESVDGILDANTWRVAPASVSVHYPSCGQPLRKPLPYISRSCWGANLKIAARDRMLLHLVEN